MANLDNLLNQYGHKAEDDGVMRFYQIPKILFNNPRYKGLSADAKIAYAILRDRQDLSKKNGWTDENGFIFFIYTNKDLEEILECSKNTVTKIKKELEKYELLINKQMGQGKPSRLYILKPNYDKKESENKETEEKEDRKAESYPQAESIGNTKTPKNWDSRNPKFGSLDSQNMGPNDTDYSDTEYIKSVSQERQTDNKTDIVLNALKDDIDLYDQQHKDLIVNSVKRLSYKSDPTSLLKLSYKHFDYSINKFKAAKRDNTIKNTAAYFDKILYNSIGELAASLI